MNPFEQANRNPQTSDEWQHREEAIERFNRDRERSRDDAWEYEHHQPREASVWEEYQENWVEMTEFTGPKPVDQARLQMQLAFEEVA